MFFSYLYKITDKVVFYFYVVFQKIDIISFSFGYIICGFRQKTTAAKTYFAEISG